MLRGEVESRFELHVFVKSGGEAGRISEFQRSDKARRISDESEASHR